jgi:hypothetical protein
MAVAGGLALVGCGDGALYVIDIKEGKSMYALGAHKVGILQGGHPAAGWAGASHRVCEPRSRAYESARVWLSPCAQLAGRSRCTPRGSLRHASFQLPALRSPRHASERREGQGIEHSMDTPGYWMR